MAKKKAKSTAIHKEVHHIWGWVVLTAGVLMIFSVAAYYYLEMF